MVVAVTCNNVPPGATDFNVFLKVNVTDTTVSQCAGAEGSTVVTANPAPTLSVDADTAPAFCVADGSVRVNFTVTSSSAYSPDNWTLVAEVQESSVVGSPTCNDTDPIVDQRDGE